ncbi:hypothetical protein KCU83_g440, partial [Aureobasidium melanogenum]
LDVRMAVKDTPEHPITTFGLARDRLGDVDDLLGMVVFNGVVARDLDDIVANDTRAAANQIRLLSTSQGPCDRNRRSLCRSRRKTGGTGRGQHLQQRQHQRPGKHGESAWTRGRTRSGWLASGGRRHCRRLLSERRWGGGLHASSERQHDAFEHDAVVATTMQLSQRGCDEDSGVWSLGEGDLDRQVHKSVFQVKISLDNVPV